MAGLWGAGDYTFVLARLGPLHLGCIIGRWQLCSGGCLLRFHCTYIGYRHACFLGHRVPKGPTLSSIGGSTFNSLVKLLRRTMQPL